jgi:hypothetical protein
VIDGENRLDAIDGGCAPAVEDTSIIDQDMDLRIAIEQLSGEPVNFRLGREIRQQYVNSFVAGRGANLLASCLSALGVAAH